MKTRKTRYSKVGEFIVNRLKVTNKTQQDLAKSADVTPGYVSSILYGRYQPPAEFLHCTAEFLGLDKGGKCDLFVAAFEDSEHIYVRRDTSDLSWEIISSVMATDLDHSNREDEPLVNFMKYLRQEN